MSELGIGALLIDGPDPAVRAAVINQLAAYLQPRGVRIRLQLRAEDSEKFDRPGAGYLAALGTALLQEELVLVSGSWLRPGLLAGLGPLRARMLQRAALSCNATLVWLGNGLVLPTWLPTVRHDPMAPLESLLAQLAACTLAINSGPGAGAWRPGEVVLLVGDRPNNARHGALKARLPFVSLHSGGCSAWLADHLEVAGIPEEQLYWINAFDHFDRPTPHAFLDELKPRAIVALGANAARWCQQADVPYCQVTHPQHHKRFHHAEPYGLGQLLRQAMQLEVAA